ncbi:DsrE family protein [Halopiger thermotolerans]
MVNAAVVILAGTESHADTGRLVNGLEAAREFAVNEADDVELIFDGAGTQWIAELEDEDHEYHDLYRSVQDEAAVCDYCAGAFDVDDAVDDAGIVRIDENEGHPSIRSLVDDDYEIITF